MSIIKKRHILTLFPATCPRCKTAKESKELVIAEGTTFQEKEELVKKEMTCKVCEFDIYTYGKNQLAD